MPPKKKTTQAKSTPKKTTSKKTTKKTTAKKTVPKKATAKKTTDNKTKSSRPVDVPYVSEKETKELIKPFQEKTKNIFKKLWEKIHHPMKQINWMMFFIIMVIVTTVTMITTTTVIKVSNIERDKQEERFGLIAKLESLKQSHDYYTEMATKDELLVSWIKLFSNWSYKYGGDPRLDRGDCVGSVYEFLRKWESNIYFENVRSIVARAENLLARGELEKRSKISQVQTGDIIVIQLRPNRPEHVGIVYDVANSYVRYMDVNAGVKTWGLEKVKWGNARIYAIYSVSFSLWVGDLMKKINEINR